MIFYLKDMAVRHQLPERKYFPPMIVSQDDSIAISVEGLMERLVYVDAQEREKRICHNVNRKFTGFC